MKKRIEDELDILRDEIIEIIPVGKIFLFGSYVDGKLDSDSALDSSN